MRHKLQLITSPSSNLRKKRSEPSSEHIVHYKLQSTIKCPQSNSIFQMFSKLSSKIQKISRQKYLGLWVFYILSTRWPKMKLSECLLIFLADCGHPSLQQWYCIPDRSWTKVRLRLFQQPKFCGLNLKNTSFMPKIIQDYTF